MSLFLGNLSPYVQHRELEKVFQRFGRSNLELKDGYGFVVFEEYIDAERALRALRGRSICGERPLISWAKRHRPFHSKENSFRQRAWDSRDDERGKRRLSAHDDDKREREVADASIGSDVKEEDAADADARQNWENVGIDMSKDGDPLEGGRWGEPLSDASLDHGFDGVGEAQDELEIDERENTNGDAHEKSPEVSEKETTKGDAHDRSYVSLREKIRAHSSRAFPSSYDHHRGWRDHEVNSQPVCTRCGRLGHVVRYCRSRIRSVHPMDYFDRRNQHRSFRSNIFRGNYRGMHGSRRMFDRDRILARRNIRIVDAVNRRRFHEPMEQSHDRSPRKHHRSGNQERRHSRESQERRLSRESQERRHSRKSKEANQQKHKKKDKKSLHSKKRRRSSSTSPSFRSPLRSSSNSQSRSRSHTPSPSSSSSSSQHSLSRSHSCSSSRSKSSNSPSPSSRSGSHLSSRSGLSSRSYSTNSRSAKSLSKSPCSSRSNSRSISHSGSHHGSTSSESLPLIYGSSKESGSPSKSNAEKRARTSKFKEKDGEQARSGGQGRHISKVAAMTVKKNNLESSEVKGIEHFGAARLWPWESVLYRRLERGPVLMENYEKRKQQNEEFGITDKYIRSSSGWWEEAA